MSIFGSIVSAIFGTAKAAAGAMHGAAAPAKPKPMTREEVEAKIQKIAKDTGREKYNWKQSIVDLMKLLDLDSSLKPASSWLRSLAIPKARRLGRDEHLAP